MPVDMNLYRSLIAGGVPPDIALRAAGANATGGPGMMPTNANMPEMDPTGGPLEGPPAPIQPVQQPKSKLAQLLPLLISGGVGALAGGLGGGGIGALTGGFAGAGGYGQGEQQRKELELKKQQVNQSQMNQVLQRIQEQQRIQNEQERTRLGDVEKSMDNIKNFIPKDFNPNDQGALDAIDNMVQAEARLKHYDPETTKQLAMQARTFATSLKPEQKYLVGESGIPQPYTAGASADIPGAPDVSLQEAGVQPLDKAGAEMISGKMMEKKRMEKEKEPGDFQKKLNVEARARGFTDFDSAPAKDQAAIQEKIMTLPGVASAGVRTQGFGQIWDEKTRRAEMTKAFDPLNQYRQNYDLMVQAAQRAQEQEQKGGNVGASDMVLISRHIGMTLGNVKGSRVGHEQIEQHMMARGIPESLRVAVHKVADGGQLSPEQRKEFLRLAYDQLMNSKAAYDRAAQFYDYHFPGEEKVVGGIVPPDAAITGQSSNVTDGIHNTDKKPTMRWVGGKLVPVQ